MELNTYKKNVQALWKTRLTSPTVANIAAIAPHIPEEEIAAVLQEASVEGQSVYFALPPTMVRNAFLNAEITTYEGQTKLDVWGSSRAGSSMVKAAKFVPEAMAYSLAMWPEALVEDTWVDIGTTYVQDPTKLGPHNYPTTVYAVTYTLKRDWNRVMNDSSRPEWQQWDNAIVQVTLDPIAASELRGERGGYTEFNCAHCGGGLSLNHCSSCGHIFEDDQFRCGWSTPLPPKIVKLLEDAGHVFAISPEKLWK